MHRPRRRFEEGKTERKTSARTLVLRLLKYISLNRREAVLVLFPIVAASITSVAGPYLLGREIVAKYILRSNFLGLEIVVLVFFGIIAVNWVATALRSYITGKMGEKILFNMRSELFSHLQELSFGFFDHSDSGDVISRVTNDTDSLGVAFTSGIISIISDILSLALIIVVMFSINVPLSLVSLLVVPLILPVTLAFQSKLKATYKATRESISSVTSQLKESISGIREIKSFSREQNAIDDFSETNLQNFKANLQATKVWAAFPQTIQIIQAIVSGAVMIYGGMLAFNGVLGPIEDAIGTLITFLMYVGMFFGPILDLATFYGTIQSALVGAERIFELIDTQPEVKDVEDATETPTFQGDITFENINFGYDPNCPVLHNISFNIKPRETVALVGPTGAGKSTIIKLLSRFYDPQSGSIKIDGQDIRRIKQASLRKQIGIVLQDTFLFSGTIIDNIRYGKLEASDEEVINAAKIVGAHEFITQLQNGYNTKIGERGARLSVGQKQLVSLARALLRNPTILILDEATSSIDPYMDILIRRALKVLLKNRTCIIIAHRLSTVRKADRILVIYDGKIVEEGSHKELMKKDRLYRHLYEMQFGEPLKTVVEHKLLPMIPAVKIASENSPKDSVDPKSDQSGSGKQFQQ